MARYVSLIRFTEKGARDIKQSPARAGAFRKMATEAGVKVEAEYWTVGAYDGVLIISADKPEKALRCLTELAALGSVKTETMQTFDTDEFAAIVGRQQFWADWAREIGWILPIKAKISADFLFWPPGFVPNTTKNGLLMPRAVERNC